MHAATMQAWSRVKDPKGKDESIVYCIGVRADQIRDVISWGPGRRLELVEIRKWTLPDGTEAKTPVFRVIVKDLIGPPKVCVELKTSARRDRHNAGEYVERIEKYEENFINSEFVDKSPIFNNRENVHKSGIYNNPANKDELSLTSLSLTSLFVARFDCNAKQDYAPNEAGRYGYSRIINNFHDNPYIIKNHIKGQFTLGFYQIGLDNKVKWICFDIDDHKGERGPKAVRADLQKLFDVLTKYEIPFLLEASGSPNSYHVWILLKPTQTLNAYRFSRQIAAEADIKCEIFPKNKSLNKDGRYGNSGK